MTKEELIALYPETLNPNAFIWMGVAAIVVAIIVYIRGMMDGGLAKYYYAMGGSLIVLVGIIVPTYFYSIGIEREAAQLEKWEQVHFAKYIETLPDVDLEFEELIAKSDGSYRVRVVNEGDWPVSEVRFIEGQGESKVTAKYVEGLEQCRVADGFRKVVVTYYSKGLGT